MGRDFGCFEFEGGSEAGGRKAFGGQIGFWAGKTRFGESIAQRSQYDRLRFEAGYQADLIVEKKILLELKSIETLLPVHAKQVLTYIRLANLRVGLLINFDETRLKNGIKRLVNG